MEISIEVSIETDSPAKSQTVCFIYLPTVNQTRYPQTDLREYVQQGNSNDLERHVWQHPKEDLVQGDMSRGDPLQVEGGHCHRWR